MDAEQIIDRFGMQPHPEGGHYVETWRGPDGAGGRAVGTAILFLLRAGERSHWHRVDADEVWLHHAGDPLAIEVVSDTSRTFRLGGGIEAGEVPQVVVPANAWQSAEPLGAWTLVSCVVTPGFEFGGFELAPPDWSPA